MDKTYDAAGRLVSLLNRNAANGTISSHTLTLDGAGNPTSASLDLPLLPTNLGRAAEMLYDASNRMTHIGGAAITHDANGRLTGDPSGGDPIQYAYNAQDLITSVTRGGVLTDSYAYDGDGRRVARNSNGQTTRYVLDPTGGDLYRLLAETDGANAVQHYYVYGDGGLVSQIGGSSHRYYHFDQTGNTLALTNSSGSVTDTYAYEPFGNTTTQGNSHNPFRFVGQFGVMDDGNGLHHMRARYYRPDLRRFVSLDALYGQVDDPMTLNRYQYVSGNPMVGVDPSGYDTDSDILRWQAIFKNTNSNNLKMIAIRKINELKLIKKEERLLDAAQLKWSDVYDSVIKPTIEKNGLSFNLDSVLKNKAKDVSCQAVNGSVEILGYYDDNVESVFSAACSYALDATNPFVSIADKEELIGTMLSNFQKIDFVSGYIDDAYSGRMKFLQSSHEENNTAWLMAPLIKIGECIFGDVCFSGKLKQNK